MIRAAHLLDDGSLGGVTRALSVFDDPTLRDQVRSTIHEVTPEKGLAPRYDADVIFTHFPPRWRALPFLISLRLRNPHARLIHLEHSYTRAWVAKKVPVPGRFHALLKLSYRLFDRVVAVSRGQAAWLRDFVPQRCGPVVIHPWSGATGLEQLPLAQAEEGRPLRLLAYGRFAEQKGFDTLIEAMRGLPAERFRLTLAGFGPDEAQLGALADGLPHVELIGPVGDLAALLAQADVVVIPSRWEAYGLVAAEARLAGRPVLVSDVDGLPEQAAGSEWVADCTTPEALARAIARIDPAALSCAARAQRAVLAGQAEERLSGWRDLLGI